MFLSSVRPCPSFSRLFFGGFVLAILVALPPPLLAGSRTFGDLQVGVEHVTLDRYRLSIPSSGVTTEVPVREGGWQSYQRTSLHHIQERDLPGPWIMDTETQLQAETFSTRQVSAERFGRGQAGIRNTLARSVGEDATLIFETYGKVFHHEFLPDLQHSLAGQDVVYERELSGDAYLRARLGARAGTIRNDRNNDYSELRFELDYQHLPPERFRSEVLPAPVARAGPNPAWEFLFNHALRLDRIRDVVRFAGDAVLAADMMPDPPLPMAFDGGLVRPHIKIRDSIFAAGVQGIRRNLKSGNGFNRVAAFLGVEWALDDFLTLAIRDTIGFQDWDKPELADLRSDRVQNHFSIDLNHTRERRALSARLGVDSHFFGDVDGYDYHRPHAGVFGRWDSGGRISLQGSLRGAFELNRDPRADLPDLERFDSLLEAHYCFRPDRVLKLGLGHETVNVRDFQTEFDSAYDESRLSASYRQGILKNLVGEVGYVQREERHHTFKQNDVNDSSGYFQLEVQF